MVQSTVERPAPPAPARARQSHLVVAAVTAMAMLIGSIAWLVTHPPTPASVAGFLRALERGDAVGAYGFTDLPTRTPNIHETSALSLDHFVASHRARTLASSTVLHHTMNTMRVRLRYSDGSYEDVDWTRSYKKVHVPTHLVVIVPNVALPGVTVDGVATTAQGIRTKPTRILEAEGLEYWIRATSLPHEVVVPEGPATARLTINASGGTRDFIAYPVLKPSPAATRAAVNAGVSQVASRSALRHCKRSDELLPDPRSLRAASAKLRSSRESEQSWTVDVVVAGRAIDYYEGIGDTLVDVFTAPILAIGCALSPAKDCPFGSAGKRVVFSMNVAVTIRRGSIRILGCPTGLDVLPRS
jgi:hypothetical protein